MFHLIKGVQIICNAAVQWKVAKWKSLHNSNLFYSITATNVYYSPLTLNAQTMTSMKLKVQLYMAFKYFYFVHFATEDPVTPKQQIFYFFYSNKCIFPLTLNEQPMISMKLKIQLYMAF